MLQMMLLLYLFVICLLSCDVAFIILIYLN